MRILFYFYYFLRIEGVRYLTHYEASVYTARRLEMLTIVEATLFYLVDRPVVHSELSGLPFMVCSFIAIPLIIILYMSFYLLYSIVIKVVNS